MGGSRLSGLSLLVPDYHSAIAFFVGTLGFRLTADLEDGRKRWVTVEPPGGGCRLILARADTPQQRATIGAQGAGRVWLFLETDDFARDHARMTAQGVEFEEAPRYEAYGIVAVWRDPFGNRWDLIQPV